MTLNDLLWTLRTKLNDLDGDTYIEFSLVDYLNLSVEDLASLLPESALIGLTEKTGIPSVNGTNNYSLPADFHKLIHLTQNSKPSKLIKATQKYVYLNLPSAYAGGAAERPLHWIDNERIYVYPTPSITGVVAPTLPTAVKVAMPGLLMGTYYYKITFVTAEGETEMGDVSAAVVITIAGEAQAALASIPLGGALVEQRNIYRTKGNGSVYYLVGNLPNNTLTVFSDNIPDTSLGAAGPTAATIGQFYLDYVKRPTRMVLAADVCPISDQYTNLVIAGAEMRALNSQKQDISVVKALHDQQLAAVIGGQEGAQAILVSRQRP